MMENIVLYNGLIVAATCVVSIIIEMMILPRVIFIAKKKRLFDLPDKRKKHCEPIPRLGGITFTPVILLVTLFGIFIKFKFQIWDEILFFYRIPETILLVCGLLIIYLLGAKDDLVGVSFKKKFIIQFIAALCIVGSDVYINNFYGLFGIHEIPDILGIFLSIGLIMFTTNAINLIDGADGLASGVSAAALFIYGILFLKFGMWTYAGIAATTIGLLIPFFYYNFFHRSRKIFMGDTGSLTLGFILAFMILRLVKFPPTEVVVPTGYILLVLSALFVPLFDAFKVMIVRISTGRGPFSPDRNHIHHKLIDLGISKRKTVTIIVASSLFVTGLNWLLLSYIDCNIVLIIDIAFGAFSNMLISRAIKRREPNEESVKVKAKVTENNNTMNLLEIEDDVIVYEEVDLNR